MNLNKQQRLKLYDRRVGAGFFVIKSAENELLQIEVYTDPNDGTLRRVGDGSAVFPIDIRPDEDEDDVARWGPAATQVQPYRRSVPPEVVEAVQAEIEAQWKLYYAAGFRSQERVDVAARRRRLKQWLDDVAVEEVKE